MSRKQKKKLPLQCKKKVQNHSAYLIHFEMFSQKLELYNLHLVDVMGDGNCLFRAVSEQLEGTENKHYKYRKIAVRELQNNSTFYSHFLPEQIRMREYLEIMNEDGVWGGHLELQALCNRLGIDIAVHSLNASVLITQSNIENDNVFKRSLRFCFSCIIPALRKADRKEGDLIKKRTINIAYHKGPHIIEHYSSIRLIDNTNGKANTIPQEILNDLLSNGQKKTLYNKDNQDIEDQNLPQSSFDHDKDNLPLNTDILLEMNNNFDNSQ